MTETSGVDLARVALRAAQAAAKTTPQPKRRTGASAPRRVPGSGGREPLPFGTAISRMVAERGWELAAAGGNILEQWPAIAPTLAANVAAVRYDLETRTLHLQPATPAHRTQLNLHQRAIIAKINQAVGPDSVRHLEILTPSALSSREYPATRVPATTTARAAAPEPSIKTRADASAGYRKVLAAHRATWPPKGPLGSESGSRQGAPRASTEVADCWSPGPAAHPDPARDRH
ncbi:DUF721 domain-containing protein [Streptomyces sp. NBC_01708]|uniref:DUF721 domain-containing protein n=1 Tax=Streptomyces sp. NBC_01708 TaxID=2975915 RepID=UPI002E30DAB5|nr:DUF721 domain-containing protein [Streptomyces sp. NBC_01708]